MPKSSPVTSLLPEPGKASAQRARHVSLMRTIESQVIPRLMVLHARSNRREEPIEIGQEQVLDFSNLVLDGDETMVSAYVEALMLQGASVSNIHLDLIAPTARRLGDMWCTDVCSFADVTIGLGTLQRLIRELAADLRVNPTEGRDLQALLMPAVGEQHTLGAQMLGEFFRQAGWRVQREWPTSEASLTTAVASTWFDLVGLSLSGEVLLDALTRQVQLVRKNSMNRKVVVIVGGSLFETYPDLVSFVGADAGGGNAEAALQSAQRLLQAVA